MRSLLLAALPVILAGCGGVPNSVTAKPERTFNPLPVGATVSLWLAPAHRPDTIEALVKAYEEVEILPRPRGTRVGRVTIVHGNRVKRMEQALAEARKMGGNALYFEKGAFRGRELSAGVYRGRR